MGGVFVILERVRDIPRTQVEKNNFSLPVNKPGVMLKANAPKFTNGNLSRQTPRSQSGSFIVEESVGGGRRIGKMDVRPTQRHIVTGDVSEDRT